MSIRLRLRLTRRRLLESRSDVFLLFTKIATVVNENDCAAFGLGFTTEPVEK